MQRIIEDWYDRAGVSQKAHHFTFEMYEKRGKWLGMPTIVLSTIVGTSVFAALGQSVERWHQIAVGLMSISAAVLASLQTFFAYSERAEKHRVAAAKYGALCRELDTIRAELKEAMPETVESIRSKLDALSIESPQTPIKHYKMAWAKWDKWKKYEERLAKQKHDA